MNRYVKPNAVTEYEIPITLHWQYARESVASPSTGYNVTPETLINSIYEDIKENVLAYGFTLVTYQQPLCKKSTDPKCMQFEVPQASHDNQTVIVTIVLRIATYKANNSSMKSDAKTAKYKDGQYTYTVARWFDVAGIIMETALQLCAFIARMLGSLSEGNLGVIQSFPKHSTKKINNNSYSTIN